MTDNLEELERRYLIRKQGAWYRPNARGYTDSAIQAGRYTLAEAKRHTHPNGPDGPRDGMDYVHEDDVTDPDWIAYREAIATAREVEGLRSEVARLREHLSNINRKASPDPERTMSEASNDLYWCACEARAALEGKGG